MGVAIEAVLAGVVARLNLDQADLEARVADVRRRRSVLRGVSVAAAVLLVVAGLREASARARLVLPAPIGPSTTM